MNTVKREVLICTLLVALTTLGSRMSADTVVVPNSLETNNPAFGSGILRAANYHAQEAYGAANFPSNTALIITALRYRPDSAFGTAFTTTVASIQFNLSTTTRNPEALSATFADNVGSDDTVVFSGPLTISSQLGGPPNGPKDFDIVIPLATPFLYNPAAGNLLIDLRNFSGSSVASPLSGQNVSNDAASRVGGSLSSPSGTADHAVEALQIVFTPTNPPPVPPQPTALTRGPYLQTATPSNLVVRWRTSLATNSLARFGLTNPALAWAVADGALTNDHVVTLTNLSADTKYFYAVGASGTNFAGGSNYFFITPPAVGKPTRIWAIGDAGTANQPDSFGVTRDPFGMRDAYYSYAGQRYTDLFLMLGDNAYGVGTDDEYSTNVFGTFPAMLRQTVLWPAIGNHDAVNTDTYLNIFSLPRNGEAGGLASGTELYYSFDYGNVHFVCLDSEVSSHAPDGPMITWLKQDLAAQVKDWLIVFWHTPPYTYGSHDSDNAGDSGGHLFEMRENVVPVIEQYGVDLVLCGHSHVYERSCLLDGHYDVGATFLPTMAKDGGSGRQDDSGAYVKSSLGSDAHAGAVYAVCGSSGWVTPPVVPLDRYLKHPAMFIGLDHVGSMVIDVSSNRLDGRFLNHAGTIDDYFTILKGVDPEPLKVKTIRVSGGNVSLQFKTVAGAHYRIDRATRLGPADWQPVVAEIIATGATTKWTGASPSGPDPSFYRVVLLSD